MDLLVQGEDGLVVLFEDLGRLDLLRGQATEALVGTPQGGVLFESEAVNASGLSVPAQLVLRVPQQVEPCRAVWYLGRVALALTIQ